MKKLITLLAFGLLLFSCEKTITDDRANPFTGDNPIIPQDSIDPQSIQGLHRNIFANKCANPNCHDGAFEPDFRTIESTYQTLVYQEVIKNDTLGSFKFRVIPHNTDESWLIERLVTNDPILGQMPLYAVPLNYTEMENIKAWINKGAPDAFGNVAVYPNINAQVRYFLAYDVNMDRIDTARTNGWSSPFIVPTNEDFNIAVALKDDSTDIDQLQINRFQFFSS